MGHLCATKCFIFAKSSFVLDIFYCSPVLYAREHRALAKQKHERKLEREKEREREGRKKTEKKRNKKDNVRTKVIEIKRTFPYTFQTRIRVAMLLLLFIIAF